LNNRFFIPLLILLVLLSACQPEAPDPEPMQTKAGLIFPTETPRDWATIAPDNIATPTFTPTAPPLRLPARGRIAFQSDRDGSFEIYVSNADGTFISRLTNNPAVDVFPAWSPDGSRIAFTSDRGGSPDIYLINPDGTDLVRLTDDLASDALPAWSPDDNRIAFTSNRGGFDEIYVMNADGSGVEQLTDYPAPDLFPAWSPDGEWIVFSSSRDVNSEIYKMRPDGTELTRLTDDPAADSNPAWSPDGTRIAFISRRDGFGNLYVMNTDGGDIIQLTVYKSTVEVPSWSFDSRMIAFASDMEGSRDIFIISADGMAINKLTDSPTEDFYPSWSPEISFLAEAQAVPTPLPDAVCVNADDPAYGYSIDNPVRIGYDPRIAGDDAHQCLPWLLGPQGQPLGTEVLQQVRHGGTTLCEVEVFYKGQEEPVVMYFDIFNYEQPRAPVGFTCGSPYEYIRAISAAQTQ
jgi:Tol biopolymer transport system component